MILQAVPYLQQRFETNATILRYFQASYLLCFAIIILLTTVTLSACQEHQQPAYRARLKAALCAYVAVAALLMLSTIGRYHVRAEIYFPFTLAMVVVTAVANGLSQNAAFAFAAGFGRTEYAPAIMTGEALAGLLPSVIGRDHLESCINMLIWARNRVGTSIPLCVFRRGCGTKSSDISLDTGLLSLCHASWHDIARSSGLSNTPQPHQISLRAVHGEFQLGKALFETSMASIGKFLVPLHLLRVTSVRCKDNVCCARRKRTNPLAGTGVYPTGNYPLEYWRLSRVRPGSLIPVPYPAALPDIHLLTPQDRLHPTLFDMQYRW